MAEPEPLYPREERNRAGGREEPLADMARDLVSDVRDLFHDEMQLARDEMRQDVRRVMRAATWLALGASGAFFGLMYLLLASVLVLGNVFYLWLSALIVGVVVMFVGAIFAMLGLGRIKALNPLPKTTQSLQEDAKWLRNRKR